jgi:hypothetical protein
MNPQEFTDELKEVFWNKNKLLGLDHPQKDSIFDTIKSFLQKKNLVVVSKVEYEALLTAANIYFKMAEKN